MFILFNMVDAELYAYSTEKQETVRKKYNIAEDAFVIGHAGRFAPVKNHAFLLEVFAKFHETHPNAILMLVGSGPLKEEIEVLVTEKHLDNAVVLTGQQTDMQAYLSAMDVFVLPSLFEGLPMVALEAQANGLQCILADNITPEAALSEKVQFCSIAGAEFWQNALQQVEKTTPYNRGLSNELYNKMNLTTQSTMLEQYYIQVM